MSTATAGSLIDEVQASIGASVVRRRLRAAVAGTRERVALDLGDPRVNAAGVVWEVAASFGPGSLELERLASALSRAGVRDTVLDQLAAKDAHRRARSARLVGALRLEAAVPTLAQLLFADEPSVRAAAARALGRIGGVRSAEALLDAVRQQGTSPTLVVALARAAPDLFLEVAIADHEGGDAVATLAVAAGLRRRHTAVGPLLGLLASGRGRELAAGCRALGWIGGRVAAPAIALALDDPDWRVRMSAAKALGRLRAREHRPRLARLLGDQHAGVRSAARSALQRMAP